MTRAEIIAAAQARQAAQEATGTLPAMPAERSREEILATAKRRAKLKSLQENPVAVFGEGEYDPTVGMSTLEKLTAGFGESFYKTGKGIQELYNVATGDDEEVAQLRADEAERRRISEPLSGDFFSAGNAGNLLGETAQWAIPGLGPAKWGVKAAIGGEAMLGGLAGALKPTVEGESRGANIGEGAAWGAAIPAGLHGIASAPFKKAADWGMDWNPFFRKSRIDKQNWAAKEAHEAAYQRQVDEIKQANEMSLQSSAAQQDANVAFHEAEKARVREAAEAATKMQSDAEILRAQTAESYRQAAEEAAREEITKRAGWSATPKNKIELEERVREVGKVYGEMLESTALDMNTTIPDIFKLAKEGGLAGGESSKLAGVARRFQNSADETGRVPGQMYKTLRAELTAELEDARGLYRDQLRAAIGSMDESLENSLDPDTFAAIEQMRKQYSLGKKLEKVPFDPSKPFDPWKAQSRLDVTGDSTGTRQYLTDFAANTPKKPIEPNKIAPVPEAPIAGLRQAPSPVVTAIPQMDAFHGKPYDWGKMAAMHGVVGLSTGTPAHLLVPPAMLAASKAASNPTARKYAVNALRQLNVNTIGDEEVPPLVMNPSMYQGR